MLVQELADNAVTSFAVFGGQLYAGSATRGKIWRITAQGLEEVFTLPEVPGIGSTNAYALDIRQLLVFHGRLYVPVVDANGLGAYVWDGDPDHGWHNLVTGGAGTEPRGIAVLSGLVLQSNKSNAGARIYTHSTTNAFSGAALLTQWFDAGVPGATKALVRATARHEPLAIGEFVTVEYELDDSGVWTSLITSSTASATEATASFAAATTAKKIRFRVTLSVSTMTHSPALEELLLEYAVLPAAKAAWTFNALLEGTAELPLITLDQAAEPKTGAQLSDTLWASKAKPYALPYTDLDGEAKTVFFRDFEERVAPQSQHRGYATQARITLVEA
jgi:hypothetical protein